MKLKKIAALIAIAGVSAPAFATNGMNMEGYGPVATGMGGASFAYDNGNAGIINNPATLGFMQSGTSRFDVAIGGLHPDVTSNGKGSDADAFYMPAVGYIRKDGKISWGVGMMAQGGMGTEYSDGSFWGTLSATGNVAGGSWTPGTRTAAMATGQALKNRSEVGVGRVIFPLAYEVNDKLTVGGSLDYVWAGMDIQWLVDGAHFMNLMPGQTQLFGQASGSLVTTMGGMIGAGVGEIGWGYFNFTDNNDFSQKAKGDGWAGNLGFTYKVSPQLTIGGVYHAKTNISDMKTGTSSAQLVFGLDMGGDVLTQVPLTGQMVIKNFQWPETYGFGFSYQANDAWQFVADYKRINWADVMKNFNMSFIADGSAGNGAFANLVMDLTYYQNWKDQNVLMLGTSYKYNDALNLRIGVNLANNPVPNSYVTPLFPAIEKSHLTFGAGYKFDKASSVDFSLVYVPKVTVTNNWSAVAGANPTSNQTISMSQTNWQLMYSKRF